MSMSFEDMLNNTENRKNNDLDSSNKVKCSICNQKVMFKNLFVHTFDNKLCNKRQIKLQQYNNPFKDTKYEQKYKDIIYNKMLQMKKMKFIGHQ